MLSSGKKCNFFCFLFLRSGAASNGSSCTSWLQVRIIFLWWETSLARFEFSTRVSQSPCFSFILFYVSIFHFYFIIYIWHLFSTFVFLLCSCSGGLLGRHLEAPFCSSHQRLNIVKLLKTFCVKLGRLFYFIFYFFCGAGWKMFSRTWLVWYFGRAAGTRGKYTTKQWSGEKSARCRCQGLFFFSRPQNDLGRIFPFTVFTED